MRQCTSTASASNSTGLRYPSFELKWLSRDSWLGQRNDHALTVKVCNGCMDGFVECGAVGEGLMSEVMRLEIVPDHLDVIQFWRVFWQPLGREPVCTCGEGYTRKLADVDWPVVLDQHDRPG